MASSGTFRKRLFAKYYDKVAVRYEALLADRKREFFAPLAGRVVEVGPGTGVNLGLFPNGLEWIGIEPNEHMHPFLQERASQLGFETDLRLAGADALPLEDSSVDAVVSTLVMCSVPDFPKVLGEIRRVLRPGGRYFFWEHVLAPRGRYVRGLQHLMTPVHRFCADGCNANRDLASDIRKGGFESLELEEFEIPNAAGPPWIRPHIRGIAAK